MNPGIFKTYLAAGAIAPYRITKPGAADGETALATAATDALTGVTQQLGSDLAGDRVDVCHGGLPEVTYGGNVTRGARLTSDAQGRAVVAAPAAGANVSIIGIALTAGAVGDIQPIIYAPCVIQGE